MIFKIDLLNSINLCFSCSILSFIPTKLKNLFSSSWCSCSLFVPFHFSNFIIIQSIWILSKKLLFYQLYFLLINQNILIFSLLLTGIFCIVIIFDYWVKSLTFNLIIWLSRFWSFSFIFLVNLLIVLNFSTFQKLLILNLNFFKSLFLY